MDSSEKNNQALRICLNLGHSMDENSAAAAAPELELPLPLFRATYSTTGGLGFEAIRRTHKVPAAESDEKTDETTAEQVSEVASPEGDYDEEVVKTVTFDYVEEFRVLAEELANRSDCEVDWDSVDEAILDYLADTSAYRELLGAFDLPLVEPDPTEEPETTATPSPESGAE